jgi:hypothetical protein
LGYRFLGEGVVPYERYTDVVLVYWESEIEEFELTVIPIKEITTGIIFSRTTDILTETL